MLAYTRIRTYSGNTSVAHELSDMLSMDPQFDSLMRATDDRGDGPLHAAACNGSVECVRMLLQYGVEPDVVNEQVRPLSILTACLMS